MITLEKIQILDKKIKDAIELINRLREEKKMLQKEVADRDAAIKLLEEELLSCQNNSDQIEEGFDEVLSQLDMVEDSDAQPGQQEKVSAVDPPQNTNDRIEAEWKAETAEEEIPETDLSLDVEEEHSEERITGESTQETMQFEVNEEAADKPASEEPDIDKGIPLTPDATVIEDESHVNHSEQQENEDTRSPQDLDIF